MHIKPFLSAIPSSVMLLSLLLSPLSAASGQDPSGMPGSKDSDATRRSYFTDLKVTTNEGREVRFYSDLLKDKVVLISFFYLDCGTVCPLQNKILAELQNLLGDRLGKDILILSLTVDPARDTPGLINTYGRAWNARPGRLFLTGSKTNVDWINYKLGGYVEDPKTHKTTYLLGNVKTGHWMTVRPDTKAKVLADNLLKLAEENNAAR
jgi:protein SCO1/2